MDASRWNRRALLIAGAFAAGFFAFPLLESLAADLAGTLRTLAPFALTVLVFALIAVGLLRRKPVEDESALKARLVVGAGTSYNTSACAAVAELRKRGWLMGEGGLLAGADLENADLSGADLNGANLRGANLLTVRLMRADLTNSADLSDAVMTFSNASGANFHYAALRNAKLHNTDFADADLSMTDLRGAVLYGAVCRRANLSGADLRGAMLRDADLTDANLSGAKFDESTLLPDGTNWSAEVDLTRFTSG